MTFRFSLAVVAAASLILINACGEEAQTQGPQTQDGGATPPADSGTVGEGTQDAGSNPTVDPVDAGVPDSGTPASSTTMSFFVTSRGNGQGGNFRVNAGDADGLAGADAFCQMLATTAGAEFGAKTWRAYLSTATVSARSRIGQGPWRNRNGVIVAQNLANLHDEGGTNMLSLANSLDENGNQVPNNVHDILTGSLANGSAAPNTCANWTSSAGAGVTAQVGHSNRLPAMPANRLSWNASHPTGSCSAQGVTTGGGRGSLYCFAL